MDSTGCSSICRRAETFDLDDFDVATFEAHCRNELFDKGDFETGFTAFDDQTSLRWAEYDLRDRAAGRADFQADQILRPILVVTQLSTRGHSDFEVAYGLGSRPVRNLIESDVIPAVGLANGANSMRIVAHKHSRARLEVHEVFVVDVEPEEPIESVRPAESGDLEPRLFSR